MDFVFRNVFYLWFLLIIPLLIVAHFISLRYFKKRAMKFANFIALARVSEKVGLSSNYVVLGLRILVFGAIIFAISGTVMWYEGSSIDADYVIAIDSSASMLAEDFSPTRFEASKSAAKEFVNSLPIYSSVGVVSFSGISYINQPLTNNKAIINKAIDNIEIISSGGTDIGGAIVTGTNLLINSGKPRVVIVLTDGRDNVGLNIRNSIDYSNRNRVIVDTIGIGTEEGYFLEVDEKLGPLGVNLEELRLISDTTGGKFYYPKSIEDLGNIYSEIAKIEKTKVSIDLTFFLLIFILAILFFEWVLINTRYRVLP
ncbi:VWA domain-containing protein [Candidatus Pacearchaeota archaeon]|nr:VWA domain-containing protein [Candidatus Pacearchaeota archaeon]